MGTTAHFGNRARLDDAVDVAAYPAASEPAHNVNEGLSHLSKARDVLEHTQDHSQTPLPICELPHNIQQEKEPDKRVSGVLRTSYVCVWLFLSIHEFVYLVSFVLCPAHCIIILNTHAIMFGTALKSSREQQRRQRLAEEAEGTLNHKEWLNLASVYRHAKQRILCRNVFSCYDIVFD